MPIPHDPSRPKPRESSELEAGDPAQLSPKESVHKGVGTIALNPEMYPGLAKGAGKNGSPSE
ncbi:MAG TPA: hypothetical protein VFA15_07565, partial [Nitrososphaera sp.]|nr:hypothetical protein [Nitrososphaera sp.]